MKSQQPVGDGSPGRKPTLVNHEAPEGSEVRNGGDGDTLPTSSDQLGRDADPVERFRSQQGECLTCRGYRQCARALRGRRSSRVETRITAVISRKGFAGGHADGPHATGVAHANRTAGADIFAAWDDDLAGGVSGGSAPVRRHHGNPTTTPSPTRPARADGRWFKSRGTCPRGPPWAHAPTLCGRSSCPASGI
jgi:hypothetical protein